MSESSNGAGSSGGVPSAPTCYRHPNSRTYIRCQRCERPICVECQTQAPVGVICPECLNQARNSPAGKASQQAARRANSSAVPLVTYTLIALNVLIYALQWVPGLNLTDSLAYAPAYSYAEFANQGVGYEPWRMLTAVFTHSTGSIFHILFNMFTLFIFGRILEGMLGRSRFLVLYLASGLAGSLGVMYFSTPTTWVVGASGAIFGLVGAVMIIMRQLGGNVWQLLVLVVINLVIGFLPGMNIAWQAHLGGLACGLVMGLIFVQTRKRGRQKLQVVLVTVLIIALVGLSLAHAPVFV